MMPAEITVRPDIAVLLAGGMGTRLRQAVVDRPKILAPVAGKPFLHYLFTYLQQAGLRKVILSLGYFGEQVIDYVGDGRKWGLDLEFMVERTRLGTGGALAFASRGLTAPFFAMNGDTLFRVNLDDLWTYHRSSKCLATLSLRATPAQSTDYLQRGLIKLGADGKIVVFSEKPGNEIDNTAIPQILTNGGIYVIEPDMLAHIPHDQEISLERQVFPELTAQGKLAGLIQSGYFVDIGTPMNLLSFIQDIEHHALPELEV